MSKSINYKSLVVAGVSIKDHPDYVDSYIESGYYTDGTPISEDILSEMYDVAQAMAFESLY